jgi:hypothetical protein
MFDKISVASAAPATAGANDTAQEAPMTNKQIFEQFETSLKHPPSSPYEYG